MGFVATPGAARLSTLRESIAKGDAISHDGLGVYVKLPLSPISALAKIIIL